MSGKARKLTSIIEPTQKRFVDWLLPYIPLKIETYHLTLLTLPLSILLIILAKYNILGNYFLIFHATIIFVQYVSDILDGALGRYRNTGLIRWGFYMDHICDYFFANSVVISYSMYFHISLENTAIIIAIVGAFFVQEFIVGNIRGMINTSGYYGFGPSEARFGMILVDLILFITKFRINETFIYFVLILISSAFMITTYITQKSLWKQDMQAKNKL
jgi:phosphatidylglycerophosphate synthase